MSQAGADLFANDLKIAVENQKLEIAERSRNVEALSKFGDALDSLSSTASSVFSNSNVSASLERLASDLKQPLAQAFESASIEQARIENRRTAGNSAVRGADLQIAQARNEGRSQAEIDKLVNARNDLASNVQGDFSRDSALNKQNLIVTAVNASLQEFSAKVNETIGFIQKYASVTKDLIAFELQKQQRNAEFNDTNRGLKSSLIGFFGSNNPFATAVQQRQDVAGINDASQLQRAQAISETRQQLIDLTVLDAQLSLEEKGYENALTQTQLLSDLVAVNSGGTARFTNPGGDVDKFLTKLPQLFSENRNLTNLRQNLVTSQLNELPKQLGDKLSNIDAQNASSRLSSLSSNANPANVDLLIQAFNDTRKLSASRDNRQIDPLSGISNGQFSNQLQQLSGGGQIAQQIQSQLSNLINNSSSSGRGGNQPGQVINANIPVTISVTSPSASNTVDFNRNLEAIATTAVNKGLSKFSKDVLAMSRQ
jgi:hypothetical protein